MKQHRLLCAQSIENKRVALCTLMKRFDVSLNNALICAFTRQIPIVPSDNHKTFTGCLIRSPVFRRVLGSAAESGKFLRGSCTCRRCHRHGGGELDKTQIISDVNLSDIQCPCEERGTTKCRALCLSGYGMEKLKWAKKATTKRKMELHLSRKKPAVGGVSLKR